ncbi:hypothetical protein BCR35DRAFT_198473 [Leucosporidium creatinivorum]|uniref:Uncharacterized protein n=1 Tax=Leucosporidium creatinivorum TaxID=106004 RepID=A0A1Y2DM94_9BASI|nr:hypothetical protein BCR35DRAFT_198473 [Leucosporidium creatinivorum]
MAKTLIALAFYLDQRFALRERGMRIFWSIIADLQYVEKETGMMRQSGETIGEWLSVIWEAFVKGAIALANPDVHPRAAGQFDRRGATPHRNTPSHAPSSSYDQDSHYTQHNTFPFPSPSATPFDYATPQSYPASPPNLRQYTSTSTSTTHSSSSSYLQQPFAYQSRSHRAPLTPDESDGDDEGASDYLEHDSSTSSASTTMPGHSFASPKKRRTLRRMANSVPSFHLAGAGDDTSGRSSGVSSPDGRHGGGGYHSPTPGRPRMPRQRSRSGPNETSSATARRAGESLQVPVGGQGRGGWVAQTMAGVVGRVL